ncbi:MAG: aminotransferase class III-fold pyridoxal phosphate-dependent enzyme [Rubrivivax sp.]|nr:aminotransferase class III-fold pyridoxal phosphate-dependent enzyme [Rubrivivax sp.]
MSYAEQYDPLDGIAIVGMAGRFPGARSVDELWQLLLAGREAISRFTRDELEPSYPQDMEARAEPGYVSARGVLDGADEFDEAFFGFTPAEASLLDPQQRLFLQAAWEALEHAGHDPRRLGFPVGVYAGGTANSYYLNNLQSRRDVTDRLGLLTTQMANQGHYIATRTAYKLDLKGPALNIHTACSTSLVAVCTAVQALQAYQCDMALAGGVSVSLPQRRGYLHQEGSILSPDGHCRAFDAAAAGTVFSNGLGVVVLRRLREALDDGDTIYAVIKGAALNNDGAGKLSFTAPSVDGQAQAIALAQALGGIDPATISYIEAHGTGTALGDPIEIAGLTQAFRAGGAEATGFCAIGSLKTNIGHLDAAAGVAGLIKTALALHHRMLPASLHFRSPNPRLELEKTPFFVNDGLRPWPEGATPRRAGVSSFGVGGTNAHVVLEEAPPLQATPPAPQADALLVLSARDADALDRARRQLRLSFGSASPAPWHDLTRTLQDGRQAFGHRAAWVCSSSSEALRGLAEPLTSPTAAVSQRRVAFLLPGQGAQQAGMGRDLYAREPVFRQSFDSCADGLQDELGCDLRELVFRVAEADGVPDERLGQTRFTQPAMFALEWSLAQLWLHWGVQPAALIGHSLGEWVAACLGGTFTQPDALRLVAARARLMQALPPGRMLAVRASAESLEPELPEAVSIAARNAPQLTVLSGPPDEMARMQARLETRGIAHRPLQTSHAFHSPMMDAVLGDFRALVQATPRQPPHTPWISGLSGRTVSDAEAVSADYWVRQLRDPVQFMPGALSLLDSDMALLEVGPGRTLLQLMRRQGRVPASGQPLIASMPRPGDVAEARSLREAAAALWCSGVDLDFAALQPGAWRRVALPTYPFARNRRWVDPAVPQPVPAALPAMVSAAVPAALGAPPACPPAVDVAQVLEIAAAPAAPISEPATSLFHLHPSSAVPSMNAAIPPALQHALQRLFGELSGLEPAAVLPTASFLELGLDSLSLTQASQALQRQFGLKVPMRLLLEQCTSVAALAAHLAPQVDVSALAPPMAASTPTPTPAMREAPVHADASRSTPVSATLGLGSQGAGGAPAVASGVATELPATPAGTGAWVHLFEQQLALMAQQLQMIRQAGALPLPPGRSAAPTEPHQTPAVLAQPQPASPSPQADELQVSRAAPALATAADAPGAAPTATPVALGPYRPPSAAGPLALTPNQQEQLQTFIQRYNAHTAGSKQAAQQHRAHLADPRTVAGFRLAWKELVYPLVTVRSSGSRLWDVDGHEYIDITNGFGMILFGHNPDFVREAVAAQLETGYEIGPQSPLAGEVARELCAMVGMERAAFCGTGSEAVMAAIRVARTVTGRDTIVMFQGAYHGIFDEVLVRPGRAGSDGVPRALPIAPGIPASAMQHVVLLEYGSPDALRTIKSLGPRLAAVLVEPVQSRRPELQPREFLQELRRLTEACGAALVFDEVVTGFRVHPGGAQAVFGVRADMATYGKVLGGGLPIGVLAGSARFLDALDGGSWRYGDDSAPEVGVTFFAGTFVRHPLALAAARAVLQRLAAEGPSLQRDLNRRTTEFVERLRQAAAALGAPLQVTHFASWFCLQLPADWPLAGLFFPALRLRGVHAWEGRPCFLTTAHSDADLQALVDAVRDALADLQRAGFLPAQPAAGLNGSHQPPVNGARKGRDKEGREAWFLPDPARPGKYLQIRAQELRHG